VPHSPVAVPVEKPPRLLQRGVEIATKHVYERLLVVLIRRFVPEHTPHQALHKRVLPAVFLTEALTEHRITVRLSVIEKPKRLHGFFFHILAAESLNPKVIIGTVLRENFGGGLRSPPTRIIVGCHTRRFGGRGYKSIPPPHFGMHVALQLFAFDEPVGGFRETLRSIQDQTVPKETPISYEAWITPSSTDDPLFDAARQEGFSAHTAPQGKLSSRNAAHNQAVEDGADVIVSWDADAPAIRDDALKSLIQPFHDPEIVAVNSLPISRKSPSGRSMFGGLVDIGAMLEDITVPHIHGQCSAIRASAWEEVGPFSTAIDETDSVAVRSEEEIGFHRRLRAIGGVTFAPSFVYNDPRRHLCKIPGMGDPDYCESRGVETFQHR